MQPLFSKKQKIIALIIGLNLFLLAFLIPIISEKKQLEVVFFNIGQGSSIFIETPSGAQVLIDGGPNNLLILEKLAQEIFFWDKDIDIIISTHSSADHLIGLIEVLDRYKVDKIIWTGMYSDSLTHYQFQQKILKAEKKGVDIIIAKFGQEIKLDNDIYLKILNPLARLEGRNPINHNNNSIVARLDFNDISFLFTADIEKEKELLLVQKNKNSEKDFLDVDILMIAHHGSRTSSTDKFLEATSPSTAIIQVGKNNRHGHPHQIIVDRLINKEIGFFRTDLSGTIKIISDGKNYKIIKK